MEVKKLQRDYSKNQLIFKRFGRDRPDNSKVEREKKMKRKSPMILIFVIGGILLVGMSFFVQFVTHLLLEGAYEYTNASMAVGIGMATAALWAVVLISVLFTLVAEVIVFALLWNTIKEKLVAAIVKVAASFHFEITPEAVWSALFENKKESSS